MVMCVDCHERPAFARGRCKRCYETATRRGVIQIQHAGDTPHCTVPGCTTSGLLTRGLCGMHYTRWKRYGSTGSRWPHRCVIAGCNRAGPYRKGRCNMHYMQWRRSSGARAALRWEED